MSSIASLLGAALVFAGLLQTGVQSAEQPYAQIKRIYVEKTNVVVEVEASASLAKVTLESSTRVGRKAWVPRAVEVLKNTEADAGGAVNLTFNVPISPAIEILRVRGDFGATVLPSSFYEGTNKFVASTGASGNGAVAGTTAGGAGVFAPGAADKVASPTTDSRSVVESDIWKVDGDTLFFFNQNRGLQVIDISIPDSPKLTGTYDLAAAGEQMYLIDHDKVVLLAQDNCSWYGNSQGSRAILLQIKNGVPELVKELPVAGYIAESRLVGTALYVVANSYEQRAVLAKDGTTTTTEWEWGSKIVSFDLGNFSAAQEKSNSWIGGYGNVIYATDRYLFVAQLIWDGRTGTQNSVINAFDISSPDGTFAKLSTFSIPGTVRDKFKMQVSGETFSVVVQADFRQPRASYLKTFSFSDPKNPQPLAEVKIVENEQLFATRFDGNRLYVVTFFVIDPLWIFDLSNPAEPKKVGELHIPGWSTFLQPLGDKLLAIGLDRTNGTQRTAVQLFNVADPANPSLLSKVLIGERWSDSEANWDEKAFGVLPDDKLVLVPFWSSGDESFTQGVQLIDLDGNTLVKRGVVTHNMGARRATLHRGRLLSLSPRELLTVDVSDRDRPAVVKTTELSWQADRVHLVGDYLIEVDSGGGSSPVLRVVKADDPATIVQTVVLKGLPYMGSTTSNGKLVVLQGKPIEVLYPKIYDPTNYFPIGTNPAVFLLSEFDVDALPALPLARSTTKEGGTNHFYGQYEAISLKPNVLVWRSKNTGYYPWYGGPVFVRGGGIAVDDARFGVGIGMPIWWGGSAGHFISVDTTTLNISSEVLLSGTNGWWNFGEAFASDGRIYTSHQASEFDESIDPPPYESQCYQIGTGTWEKCIIDPPPGVWVQRYYLDVIDFNDPGEPLVRKPVNLPGSLIGLARNGELLYTRGYNIKPFEVGNWDETISASSFDGLEVHLITSMRLGENWPRPVIANGEYLYMGMAPNKTGENATLQVWSLNGAGKFELVNKQILGAPAQQFDIVRDLLAVQTSDILLMDVRTPSAPTPVGSGRSAACYGILFDAADGEATRGLWIPVGWYGVLRIPVKVQQ